ncbi:alkaline phosphatase D family protein [Botrimarina hoheduenensis]|uniref:PhoD-like phosphatase n=1 Tax=Botrimarina hoheduenensis TaxID=2528000 RepID=A0A5C5WEV9_9BACT|nr:alkaline phosphatase D family protein [Botrimarina hoheduenensis]TWT48585.1 PhoD-like phosphatase [Botrimarina hoheduenensis]
MNHRALLATPLFVLACCCLQDAAAQPPDRKQGVCFVLYTVQDSVLKLTAQLYPLGDSDSRVVALETQQASNWTRLATAQVREKAYSFPQGAKSWTAHFRVPGWNEEIDIPFRVVCLDGAEVYAGKIRGNRHDKNEIVVAAFSCNSNADTRLKPDLIRNVKAIDADLLFFAGDQVYTHRDHLSDWLRFGEQFGDVTRDRPTVVITDDHDVGQGNLWGAGGRPTKHERSGGYVMPAAHVKEVEWAQTSHLPDPYDATPIKQGIGVYYTRLNVGGIDFAILEDRKFKSGPDEVLPRGIRNRMRLEQAELWDPPSAELLGQRQLDFLDNWSADWRDAAMKCVLSQTVFACPHTNGTIDGRTAPSTDTDTNGWPRTGRDRALAAMRKGAAFHVCGDLHLANVIHHGITDWGDAAYSFATPAIVNYFPRVWRPNVDPQIKLAGGLPFAGSYYDGFGNRMTVHAYANPEFGIPNYKYVVDANAPLRGADGFGVVRFDKTTRQITMECWPRLADVTDPQARQHDGWPITIGQYDNDARKPIAWLPELRVTGMTDAVVQVVSERTGEIVYTRRMKGQAFRPPVFAQDVYTVRVGEQPDRMRSAQGLTPASVSSPAEPIPFAF